MQYKKDREYHAMYGNDSSLEKDRESGIRKGIRLYIR